MIHMPQFRRPALALAACALLSACGGGEPEAGKEAEPSAAGGEAARAAAAPAGPGGRATEDITFLASIRPLHCASPGFFPQPSVVVTATGNWQNAPVAGGHFLRFDSAAVPAGTQFTVTRPHPDTAALHVEPPAGIAYAGLVGLTISYAACPGADTTGYGLFRQLPDRQLQLQGRANRNRSVTAELDHFSTYIVAGN